jgi:phage shock protein A
MSILSRFAHILSANINSLLDKAEDPSKMINQYLIDARKDLAEVKEETASVMADEVKAKRVLDANRAEIEKYTSLAKKALEAGNEGDARTFIAKKQSLENTGAGLEVAYATAHENALKMRQLHDKLVSDISQLEAKKSSIEAKVSIAKTQEKLNKFTNTGDKFNETMAAFERMEDKADKMLDVANAKSELDAQPIDDAKALEEKYKAGETASVEDELAELKKAMGLEE